MSSTLQEIVASGDSKKYLGKKYTIEDIDSIGQDEKDELMARYTAIKQAEYASSLKDTFCSVVAEVGCKVLSIKNVKGVKQDLANDPFTTSMVGHLASAVFSTFGFAFTLVVVGSILAKHKLSEKYDSDEIDDKNDANPSNDKLDTIAQAAFDKITNSI